MSRKKIIRQLGTFTVSLGFDPRRVWLTLRNLPIFLWQLIIFLFQNKKEFQLRLLPILSDKGMAGGVAKGHYFHQDLWFARLIYEASPIRHIDVGSRVDGFISHLLVFRSVEIIDIRKLDSNVKGLSFLQGDMMSLNHEIEPADSVSCLHTLEHFGLGRYGDPLNLDGWEIGLKSISLLVKPGGYLYLSVPISSKQVIEMNAQRIFFTETIPNFLKHEGFKLKLYSLIDDNGDFHENVNIHPYQGDFGCGCYVFQREAL